MYLFDNLLVMLSIAAVPSILPVKIEIGVSLKVMELLPTRITTSLPERATESYAKSSVVFES